VRIYRLQVRIIQLAILLTVIVMVLGYVNFWPGGTEEQLPAGNISDNVDNNSNGDAVSDGNKNPVKSKIVCLGDSYTIGYPGEINDSWPQVAANILKIDILNAGKVYQNTNDLLTRFDQDVLAKDPAKVVIFAGVGDALQEKTLEEYKSNVTAMVEKALTNNIKPILALPIPYPNTETLYSQYIEWETAYATEKKLTTLNFKEVLFDSDGKILRKYSDDGKYPNKDGYRAMGEYAAKVLQ